MNPAARGSGGTAGRLFAGPEGGRHSTVNFRLFGQKTSAGGRHGLHLNPVARPRVGKSGSGIFSLRALYFKLGGADDSHQRRGLIPGGHGESFLRLIQAFHCAVEAVLSAVAGPGRTGRRERRGQERRQPQGQTGFKTVVHDGSSFDVFISGTERRPGPGGCRQGLCPPGPGSRVGPE